MTKRSKNIVSEGHLKDLEKSLEKTIKKIGFIKRWCEKNIPRTDKSVSQLKILQSVSDYLEIAKLSLQSHISVLALATRSQYELNIRLRSIIEKEGELNKWNSEAITDKVQTLEGILLLSEESENLSERAILNQEISRLKGLIKKYSLPTIKNPEATGSIAKSLNMTDEHKGMYKLFSKLVHPSSYLVNDYNNAGADETRKILQIHVQLYALDSIERICKSLCIPVEITKPYGTA